MTAQTSLPLSETMRRALVASLTAPIMVGSRCVVVGTKHRFRRDTIEILTRRGLMAKRPSARFRVLSPEGRELAEQLKARGIRL